MATDSSRVNSKNAKFTKEATLQEIDRNKIVQNINRLLEKASTKHLLLLYQVAYEIVKKAQGNNTTLF